MMNWGTGGGGWWGILMMVLFLVALIVSILLVVRVIDGGRDRSERRDASGPSAHEILDARFARGEISKEEYEERSKVLSANRDHGASEKKEVEVDMNTTAKELLTASIDRHVPEPPRVRTHGSWRPSVNITPPERVGRIVTGVAATIAGALLLGTAGTILSVSLEVLLIFAGLDLVITGALGHCPLYRKLGYLPSSMRRPV